MAAGTRLVRWYEIGPRGVLGSGHFFAKCSPRTICGNAYGFWLRRSGEKRNIFVADVEERQDRSLVLRNIQPVFFAKKPPRSILVLAAD